MLTVFLFLVLIFSTLFSGEPTNFDFTNVFDFMCQFLNYVAFDKMQALFAFTKYNTHHAPCQSCYNIQFQSCATSKIELFVTKDS